MKRDVEFKSEGETISAFLYTPDGVEAPYPVVIMAGGWCYTKELRQPLYAEAFTQAGLAALVFDYRCLGASGGTPRQHLNPWDQIEDYKNAITYAHTLDEIDEDRVGAWGISYSGGHVLIVGATDERVKCVVSNVPVVDGYDTMRRVHGSIGFRRLLQAVAEERSKRFATGEYGYIPMSTPEPATTLSTWPFPEVHEVFTDLKATEAPAHEHYNTIASAEMLMSYSVFPFLQRIVNTPTLMLVADHDDITSWDREIEAYHRIPSNKKKLFVIGDTSHMTLYSNKSALEIAAQEAADWFREHLVEPYMN